MSLEASKEGEIAGQTDEVFVPSEDIGKFKLYQGLAEVSFGKAKDIRIEEDKLQKTSIIKGFAGLGALTIPGVGPGLAIGTIVWSGYDLKRCHDKYMEREALQNQAEEVSEVTRDIVLDELFRTGATVDELGNLVATPEQIEIARKEMEKKISE